MRDFLNYFGQLRMYSLVDLILLLVVIGTGTEQLIGAVVLHIAFLVFLESRHSHSYRKQTPEWISYILAIFGLVLYGKIEGFIYLIFSYLYTKKNKGTAFMSPLVRGFQNFFIVAGIIGYQNPITYLAGGLLCLRNLAGDLRDTEKDRGENMRTVPVILGIRKSIKHIHLVAMIATSVVWWSLSSISIYWLLLVILIEVSTYYLTPR
ncbi:MAG: hypothetical protein WCK48_02310 [bacterium]